MIGWYETFLIYAEVLLFKRRYHRSLLCIAVIDCHYFVKTIRIRIRNTISEQLTQNDAAIDNVIQTTKFEKAPP